MSKEQIDVEEYIAEQEAKSEIIDIAFEYKAEAS